MRSAVLIQIVAGVSVLTAYALRRWANPGRMARRSMSGLPITPIAQLVEAERSHICGVAEAAGPTITSPVDRQACIGFRLLIERRKAGGEGEYWHPVASRLACQPFRIRDDSGEATVEGPFRFGLDVDDSGWAGLPSEVYEILDEEKVSMKTRFGGDYEFRFSQAFLKSGDRVEVLGRAVQTVDPTVPAAGGRTVPLVWHFKGSEDEPVVLADADDAPDA